MVTSTKTKLAKVRPIAITPELQDALALVESASSNNGDGMCRFEFYIPDDKALQKKLKPLEDLLWKHDDPSATYHKHGRLVRCRFTVPAKAFQPVVDAWEDTDYVGKKSFAVADLKRAGKKFVGENAP